MALCTSSTVVVAATVMLLLITSGGAAGADDEECPASGLVYPYWSMCWNPAMMGEAYQVSLAGPRWLLAPEWDETNSTYYVRLVMDGSGAKYAFIRWPWFGPIAQSYALTIYNVETGRSLGFRQEGEDEWFLIEGDTPAFFQFYNPLADNNIHQPQYDQAALPSCPTDISAARCEVYSILNFPTSRGLRPYRENGITYFRLSDDIGIPFALLRPDASSSSSSAPEGNIKMATARRHLAAA